MNYIAHAVWLSFASSPWQFYVSLPCYLLKLLRDTAQVTAVQIAGQEAGFGNGEITAMLYNAQTVVGVVAPVPWAFLYGKGVRVGSPGMFYWAIAAFTVLKLTLSHTIPLELPATEGGAKKAAGGSRKL